MRLSLDDVAALCHQIARGVDDRLHVSNVLLTTGGTDRIELLVTVDDRPDESCRHLLNVTRVAPDDLARELGPKLRRALSRSDEAR